GSTRSRGGCSPARRPSAATTSTTAGRTRLPPRPGSPNRPPDPPTTPPRPLQRVPSAAMSAPPVRVAVLTVSDAGARGERADASGDAICQRLAGLPATVVSRALVPDEPEAIAAAVVEAAAAAALLVITGGTGLGPRDVTPQSI